MRSLRTALAGLGLIGLAVGVVTIAVIAASDQPDAPEGAVLVIGSVIGWAFIGTGLFAWLRRPDNRSGALMTTIGFVWFIAALSASDTPGVFIVGTLFGAVTYALLLHMLVAFPSGRLTGKWERRFVGLAYIDTTLIPWIAVLVPPDGGPQRVLRRLPGEPDRDQRPARVRRVDVQPPGGPRSDRDHRDRDPAGPPLAPLVGLLPPGDHAGAVRRDRDALHARLLPARRRHEAPGRGGRGRDRPREPDRLRHRFRLPSSAACFGPGFRAPRR